MSGYTLTLKPGHLSPHDGSIFQPDNPPVNDPRFNVEGSPGGKTLTVRGLPALSHFGANMKQGKLIVDGNAGDDLGASMIGGTIHVTGNARHRVGGPSQTSNRGMIGGEIYVDGHAGDYVGLRQRGGIIFIQGAASKSPGYRMLAGTIVVGGGPIDQPGLEMRRGSIVCLQPGEHTITNFQKDGQFPVTDVTVLRLLLRKLNIEIDGTYTLWRGDRFELNKGELWLKAC